MGLSSWLHKEYDKAKSTASSVIQTVDNKVIDTYHGAQNKIQGAINAVENEKDKIEDSVSQEIAKVKNDIQTTENKVANEVHTIENKISDSPIGQVARGAEKSAKEAYHKAQEEIQKVANDIEEKGLAEELANVGSEAVGKAEDELKDLAEKGKEELKILKSDAGEALDAVGDELKVAGETVLDGISTVQHKLIFDPVNEFLDRQGGKVEKIGLEVVIVAVVVGVLAMKFL